MKTINELMIVAKTLFDGLAELQEAERSKENMPDIVDWLNYARQHPLAGHPLTTVDNLETQEIYIKLLFTVAMCHIYLNHEISPLVYPCQIAASLGDNINGERLFKESLSLDSLTIRKYCEQIKGQGLDAYFLIDSLIITGKYEQDNHEKYDSKDNKYQNIQIMYLFVKQFGTCFKLPVLSGVIIQVKVFVTVEVTLLLIVNS